MIKDNEENKSIVSKMLEDMGNTLIEAENEENIDFNLSNRDKIENKENKNTSIPSIPSIPNSNDVYVERLLDVFNVSAIFNEIESIYNDVSLSDGSKVVILVEMAHKELREIKRLHTVIVTQHFEFLKNEANKIKESLKN